MKTAWVTGLLLVSTGCIADQMALQALFYESDPTAPSVAGVWRADDETAMITIRADDDGYQLVWLEDGKTSGPLQLRVGRIGGELYWDATTAEEAGGDDLRSSHQLPLHSIARLQLSEDALAVESLSSDWVKTALADGRLEMPHVLLDETPILAGSSAELQRMLTEHGGEEGVFDQPVVLRRVGD